MVVNIRLKTNEYGRSQLRSERDTVRLHDRTAVAILSRRDLPNMERRKCSMERQKFQHLGEFV